MQTTSPRPPPRSPSPTLSPRTISPREHKKTPSVSLQLSPQNPPRRPPRVNSSSLLLAQTLSDKESTSTPLSPGRAAPTPSSHEPPSYDPPNLPAPSSPISSPDTSPDSSPLPAVRTRSPMRARPAMPHSMLIPQTSSSPSPSSSSAISLFGSGPSSSPSPSSSSSTENPPQREGFMRGTPLKSSQSETKRATIEKTKGHIIKHINNGCVKNILTEAANGADTVSVEVATKKIEEYFRDYFENLSYETLFSEPTSPRRPSSPFLSHSSSPSPRPSTTSLQQTVKEAIDKGDVLGLNHTLKKMDIKEFMSLCLVPKKGYNPLHYASLQGQYQVVHFLLKKKADPTIVAGQSDVYAVHLFLQNGISKAIEAIEKSNKGQEDDEADPYSTFLIPVVQRLLAGVDVNTQTAKGDTLLHDACTSGAPAEVVQVLFQKGANPNVVNGEGLLPIHILMRNPNDDTHKIIQMMAPELNVLWIQDKLEGYLEEASQMKNKYLFNALLALEVDVEKDIYFKHGFLDFPSDLTDAAPKSITLLKCATFDRLLEIAIYKDHGDEETYGALCVKFHKLGTTEEAIRDVLSAHVIMRKHEETNRGICSFFEYFCRQPIFEKNHTVYQTIAEHFEAYPSDREKSIMELSTSLPVHSQLETIQEQVKLFENGKASASNLTAIETAKYFTMWNMYLHQLSSETDLIRYIDLNELDKAKNENESKDFSPEILSSFQRVQKAIQFFNNVSFWAATIILIEESPEERREKFEFVVKIMDFCLTWKNFNTAYALFLGLKLRAVAQLPGLFDSLSDSCLNHYSSMGALFSYKGSYKQYREEIKRGEDEPCIPYLGLLLRDLTYANDGSPDFWGKLRNFNIYKQRRLYKLAREYHTNFFLPSAKQHDFKITEYPKFLSKINQLSQIINEDTLFSISQFLTNTSNKTKTVRISKLSDSKSDFAALRASLKKQFDGVFATQPAPSESSESSSSSSTSVSSPDYLFRSSMPSTQLRASSSMWGIGRTKMGTRPESTRGVLEARGGGEGGLSEDVSYRIAVSSHDGEPLGYLQMFLESKSGVFGLSLSSNAQAKEVEFRIEKAEKASGCYSFYSVCANAYVGSLNPTPPSEPPPTPQEFNCVDISSKEWKIHRNEDLSEPQYFALYKPGRGRRWKGDDEVSLMIGPTSRPLQFHLQRISNLMKATITVLEGMGIGAGKMVSPRKEGKLRSATKGLKGLKREKGEFN